MAGIGFTLQRLSRQDNLSGIVKAYSYSAFAAAGPWLFTLISLATIISLASGIVSHEYMTEFRTIIIYNFCFSLVLSGPIFMIATRYLADSIHARDVSNAPGMLIGSIIIMYVILFPLAILFYIGYAEFDFATAIAAIINVMLISTIWLAGVFLSALKDFKSVTIAFAVGMAIAAITSLIMAERNTAIGLLNGFSIGLAFILAIIFNRIFSEYNYKLANVFQFLSHFRKYWEIALGGLIYNAAIWIDKWIMWFSPEATTMKSGLPLYPHYDSAMFYAYLTIIPSMALFIFNIETGFYKHYRKFYDDIKDRATYNKIEHNMKNILRSIVGGSRSFLFLQGTICIMAMMMAPKIFEIFSLSYLQISIFRFGVLGAFFHVMALFILILLAYFDLRKIVLLLQVFFLISNGVFTWALLPLGFEYYGFGYFMSAMLTFVISALVAAKYISNLPFHTFITTNTSVRA